MDTQWIIWFFVAVILLVIIFIGFVAYRKKKQYDFVFKMMKQQKKEQERVAQKEAFEAKREAMSSEEAAVILQALGGQNNIIEIEQNAIRIRVQVEDKALVDEQALRLAGVSGIIKTAHGLQLIIGDRADQVAQEMKQIVEQS
jgi:glucose-like phosphotransferase system IIB component